LVRVVAPVRTRGETRESPAPAIEPDNDGGGSDPRYLTFQLFIYAPPPDGKVASPALNESDLSSTIDEIMAAVNHHTGEGVIRQLGFVLGPITLDHTADQPREIIQGGFALAETKGLAIAFSHGQLNVLLNVLQTDQPRIQRGEPATRYGQAAS
jgi:hypothetical protein